MPPVQPGVCFFIAATFIDSCFHSTNTRRRQTLVHAGEVRVNRSSRQLRKMGRFEYCLAFRDVNIMECTVKLTNMFSILEPFIVTFITV